MRGGRNVLAAGKAALDVWYVHNASLALDVKILLHTVPMVLFGETVNYSAIRQAWRELHEAGIALAQDEPRPVVGVAAKLAGTRAAA